MNRVAATFLVSTLLLSGSCKRSETPTGPSPSPSPSPTNILYAVVGASDALGVGSSAPCFLFEDCNGAGYAPLVKRRFQNDGAMVQLANRGIPAAVLSAAMLALARDLGLGQLEVPGTFIDQIAPFVPRDATHISIFAGANDANIIGRNVRAGRGAADVRAFIDGHVQQFGRDAIELINRLRATAPNARIVAMNLPNLAATPYVAALPPLERSLLQRIAVGIADRINALASMNVIVVDLLCDARVYNPANFSNIDPTQFHPSDQGYALMAEVLYPALRSGAAPAPSANCPQRILVPVF
jgi:lysophospholipase L1-like esterase